MRAKSSADGLCMSLFSAFKRSFPVILLICYSLFGGWLFSYLEGPSTDIRVISENETLAVVIPSFETDWEKLYEETFQNVTSFYDKRDRRDDVLRSNLTRRLWQLDQEYDHQVPENIIQQVWRDYDMKRRRSDFLVQDLINNRNSSIEKFSEVKSNPWDLWSATLYAATLYTTIGYGNIAPKTIGGRIATMIYAIFGIPMVVAILNDFGQILFDFLKWAHALIKKCVHRRSKWKLVPNGPQEVTDLSITSAILILISWLCLSSAIFLIWEDWDYFTAFYFFFITLTTIGLGDVVPDYPAYTLMAFLLVLIGLSVVSMSINIIQAKVENMFNNMIKNIDNEYRQKQIDPEGSKMNEKYSGGMGIMQMFKNIPLKDRIILNLMGDHKKQLLEEHWEQKARTRNVECQTELKKYAIADIQVDMDEDNDYRGRSQSNRQRPFKVKNSYIYNLGD